PGDRDRATFAWLANRGAAAWQPPAAGAPEEGGLKPGERVALLGIGSGINCVMLACEWGATAVRGGNG
ncbi:MAG: 3-oxoacyl-ACP synthase III, partial [Planctomycetota bacterium]